MPPKITSKNLSYDTSVPPFLAALRAQASGSSGPDPLLAAQRRTAKKRSSSEEAEDVPLVVDEEGNVVKEVEVDKNGVVVKELQTHDEENDEPAKAKEPTSKASIGGRKRKAGKVVGEAADQQDDKDAGPKGAKEGESKEKSKERKPKKKSKKIKLSFDEDEG
jgi:hypothetical protein